MRVLTIIPARSGSKRLPGKNWEKVGGKTLLQLALDYAEGFMMIVSDAPERCPKEERGGPITVLEEPADLAGDDAPMSAVVKWACGVFYEKFARAYGCPEVVVLLQPTSPLRSRYDVAACVHMFERERFLDTRPDSVVSVVRRKTVGAPNSHFETNGAVYAMSWEQASTVGDIGGDTRFYVMPPERSIDINTAEDLAKARRLAGDE